MTEWEDEAEVRYIAGYMTVTCRRFHRSLGCSQVLIADMELLPDEPAADRAHKMALMQVMMALLMALMTALMTALVIARTSWR